MKKAGKDGRQNHPSQLFSLQPLITIMNAIYFLLSNAEAFIYLESRFGRRSIQIHKSAVLREGLLLNAGGKCCSDSSIAFLQGDDVVFGWLLRGGRVIIISWIPLLLRPWRFLDAPCSPPASAVCLPYPLHSNLHHASSVPGQRPDGPL